MEKEMILSEKKNKDETLTRMAIVDEGKCKPTKCNQECKKSCPIVRMGKMCIEVDKTSKTAFISESLCIGCGICVKKCPFDAIRIVNLPKELNKQTSHRYSANSFKLHRLPTPRPGNVLGILGGNGMGKSTALKILAGKVKPNLGSYANPPGWEQIISYYRGSELQNYFKKVVEENLHAVIKPQHVFMLPKLALESKVTNVGEILKSKDERGVLEQAIEQLELKKLLEKDISVLSGGELQRFAIALTFIRKADVYMFDEPSSFLDVHQRLGAARLIRSLAEDLSKYVIVVEHDLSILEFLSDYLCLLYGSPGHYGVVTKPSGTREGINIFLDGYIPTENLQFRKESLTFKFSKDEDEDLALSKKNAHFTYPDMKKTLGNFSLEVKAGFFSNSEIVVLLGQNGTGKTTFIKLLAGKLIPDGGVKLPELRVSYKPQEIEFKIECTVRQLFQKLIPAAFVDPLFISDVLKPMKIEQIMDNQLSTLSGGETQRVAIILCLGTAADLYLIDEPSAMLDAEERIVAAKVIKRFVMHNKKTAFIVEHDFLMAMYMADKIIVYEGEPSVKCVANAPQSLKAGMNSFLAKVGVTFRQDPRNFRPRINKVNGASDREQKKTGEYFRFDL